MHYVTQKRVAVVSAIVSLIAASVVFSSGLQTQTVEARSEAVVEVPVDSIAVLAKTGSRIQDVRIPSFSRNLNGRRVRLHGTMFPTFDETGLKNFTFIPETRRRATLAFRSERPPLHSIIPVSIVNGETEDYQERPFTIEGVFEVRLQEENGKATTIYRLLNARIVEKNIRLRGTPAVVMFGC